MTPSTDAAFRHACRLFIFLAWVLIATSAAFVLGWVVLFLSLMAVMA